MEGKSLFVPKYEEDFENGETIKILSDMTEEIIDNEIHVSVTFLKVKKNKEVKATYIFNKEGLQIRHIVHSIVNHE